MELLSEAKLRDCKVRITYHNSHRVIARNGVTRQSIGFKNIRKTFYKSVVGDGVPDIPKTNIKVRRGRRTLHTLIVTVFSEWQNNKKPTAFGLPRFARSDTLFSEHLSQ